MPFNPGQSGNPAGRPTGIPSKPKPLRLLITRFLTENFDSVIKDIKSLQPKDRVKAYMEMLPYGAARLATLNVEHNVRHQLESLDGDELLNVIDAVLNSKKTIHIKSNDHGNETHTGPFPGIAQEGASQGTEGGD